MSHKTSLLSLSLVLSLQCFAQADALFYSIVASGNIKGFYKEWKHSDGSYESWYQFNDRGRGDSIRTVYREDAEGYPLYIKAGGVDYMKNAVEEEFSWADGKARWKNSAEEEEQALTEKAFYMPLKTSAGHLGRALQKNQNKLKLLPYGEIEQTVLENHTLKNGAENKTVRLVQLKGMAYTPGYAWVDENGDDFAQVNEWQSIIRQGYESSLDELLQLQKKHETLFFTQLASSIPTRLEGWLLLKNVALFDAKNAKLLPANDILLQNGVVKRIARANTIKQPGAQVVDGSGKTVMPGLWDMHTHISGDLEGILQIAAGVTHVRDMGNGEGLLGRMKTFHEKSVIGPRVEVISGFIDAVDPMAAPTGVQINNVEEGKKPFASLRTRVTSKSNYTALLNRSG